MKGQRLHGYGYTEYIHDTFNIYTGSQRVFDHRTPATHIGGLALSIRGPNAGCPYRPQGGCSAARGAKDLPGVHAWDSLVHERIP